MEYRLITKESKPSLVQAIIFIVAGVILTFWSGRVLSFIVELIGASIIIIGAISILSHYSIRRRYPEIKKMVPLESYASIVFGVILMCMPTFFVSILMLIMGIIVVLGAVIQIYSFFQLKRAGMPVANALFISPTLMLIIGLVIITNPYDFASAILVMLFGIFSLIFGITSLCRYFLQKKFYSQSI